MTLPMNEDRSIMGTPQDAHDRLVEKARAWRELRQPRIDTAAGHKKIDVAEREARFQVANAALFWLWHVEHSDTATPEDDVAGDGLRCIACSSPFAEGDAYFADNSGGFIHAACCGPERESYCDENGDPLGPNDPIPEPAIWIADDTEEEAAA